MTDYLIQSRLLRWVALLGGLVLTAVSFRFSYQFGESISWEMAVACGALSILSSFMIAIWLGVREMIASVGGAKVMRCVTAVCLALMGWDAFTNSMTASFQRHNDITAATLQQTAFDNKGRTGADLAKTRAALEARAKRLDDDMAKLVETKVETSKGVFTVSVRPAAPNVLDGAISAKEHEVEMEGKRGGCKTLCQDRKRELAHLMALRAMAKQIEDNHNEHARVLASLANVRNEQAALPVEQSGAWFQAKKAAIWLTANGERQPSQLSVAWTEDMLGSFAGIMVMIGAQVFTALGTATRGQLRCAMRRPEDDAPEMETEHKGRSAVQPARPHIGVAPIASRSFEPAETVAHTAVPAHEVKRVDERNSVRDAIERVIERAKVNGGLGGISMPARVA